MIATISSMSPFTQHPVALKGYDGSCCDQANMEKCVCVCVYLELLQVIITAQGNQLLHAVARQLIL